MYKNVEKLKKKFKNLKKIETYTSNLSNFEGTP